ncbi:MAG: tetratricopeptide repeat protein [bacterium]|nr:tetratricopeptide repeat protein [bacterium]
MRGFLFFILFAFSVSCQEGENLLEKAGTNFKDKRFEEAIKLYQEYLTFWPEAKNASKAQFQEAESLFQLNRFKEAIPSFKKTADLYPLSDYASMALLRIGDSYYRIGDNKKAIKAYEEVIKKAPETKEAEEATSSLSAIKKEEIKAPQEIAISKEELTALSSAKKLYEESKWDEAYKSFCKFIEDYPRSSYIVYAKLKAGESLYQQKKFEEAIPFYKDIIANHTETKYAPYANYTLAWAYYETNNLNEAYKQVSNLLEKYPDSSYQQSAIKLKDKIEAEIRESAASSLFLSAKEAFQNKEWDKAKTLLSQIKEKYPQVKPSEVDSLLSEVNKILAEGSYSEIKRLYDEANGYLKQSQWDKAIEGFRKVIFSFPETDWTGLSKKALALATEKKQETEADAFYKEAELLLEKGELGSARPAFQKILKDFPLTKYAKMSEEKLLLIADTKTEKESEANYKEGLRLMEKERFSDAIEKLVKIPANSQYAKPAKEKIAEAKARLYENDLKRGLEIAMNYYELGDYKEAINRLQRIIAGYPESAYTKKAKAIINNISAQSEERSAEDLFKVAQNYLEEKNYDRAFEAFKKVIELYPQTRYAKTAVVIMGEINQRLANEKAKKIYDEARNLSFQKDYPNAIKKYDELLSVYPLSYWAPYAIYGKGESYYESGDYQSAALEWEGSVLRFPDSDLACHSLYHLADSFIKLNREAEAIDAYKKILLSYPESVYGRGEIRTIIKAKISSLSR